MIPLRGLDRVGCVERSIESARSCGERARVVRPPRRYCDIASGGRHVTLPKRRDLPTRALHASPCWCRVRIPGGREGWSVGEREARRRRCAALWDDLENSSHVERPRRRKRRLGCPRRLESRRLRAIGTNLLCRPGRLRGGATAVPYPPARAAVGPALRLLQTLLYQVVT